MRMRLNTGKVMEDVYETWSRPNTISYNIHVKSENTLSELEQFMTVDSVSRPCIIMLYRPVFLKSIVERDTYGITYMGLSINKFLIEIRVSTCFNQLHMGYLKKTQVSSHEGIDPPR